MLETLFRLLQAHLLLEKTGYLPDRNSRVYYAALYKGVGCHKFKLAQMNKTETL